MAAVLMATNGPLARCECLCSARATSSLPVPDSPVISTVALLGATASIRLMLTKYQKEICDRLSSFTQSALPAGTKGLLPVIGSFIRQDSMYAALLLSGVNENLSFPIAFMRGGYEINSGTKYRRYIVEFEAWLNQTDYTQITTAQTRTLFTQTTP